MHPDLADQLAHRALLRREADAERHDDDLKLIVDSIVAVANAIGGVQKAIGALIKTVARRPSI